MTNSTSHDDLVKHIKSRGWKLISSDDSTTLNDHTLEDLLKIAHKRHKGGQTYGLIKNIETHFELDIIQLEKLWQYLGLPD